MDSFLFLIAPGALANAMSVMLKKERMASSQLRVDDTRFTRPGLLDFLGLQRHVYVWMALTCVRLNLMKDLNAPLVVMSLA